ncbi:MAG TPA: hypothetical protein VNL16_12370 [Chloroflexota bacterium]|nr:hypothetical protein [Chloroflexota bacterium]
MRAAPCGPHLSILPVVEGFYGDSVMLLRAQPHDGWSLDVFIGDNLHAEA